MKVQVLIDEGMVFRIDRQAKRFGLSRSAYSARAILSALGEDEAQERALENRCLNPNEKENS